MVALILHILPPIRRQPLYPPPPAPAQIAPRAFHRCSTHLEAHALIPETYTMQGFNLQTSEVGTPESLAEYVLWLVNGTASQQNLTPAVGIVTHFSVRP